MSAIKKFFEKKKTDAKFKLAGSGQKLGDAASAEATASQRAARNAEAAAQRAAHSSGTYRQLSHEKKLAASAALDRYCCFHIRGIHTLNFSRKTTNAVLFDPQNVDVFKYFLENLQVSSSKGLHN